jgi:nicotinamidase-related amidase
MKNALVLIDLQTDYFHGGKNELHLPACAAEQAGRVLELFRSRGMPVFHIRHLSGPNGTFFVPGTAGAEIYPAVAPREGEKIFDKHYPNAFLKTGLSEELLGRQIDHLVICGMMSHMCVSTSVRAAQDYGFSVTVPEDACTTKDLVWRGAVIPAETVHRTVMASLNGTFAAVVETDEFLSGDRL